MKIYSQCSKCRCSILSDKDAFTRPHGRRRRSEKSSQGQWARNKFNGAAYVPRGLMHTLVCNESSSSFVLTSVAEKRGPYYAYTWRGGQAGRRDV